MSRSLILLLASALPAAAVGFFQSSPLAYDTTRLESNLEYLKDGRSPAGYVSPEGQTYNEYSARYPREALLSNAWCWSGNTTHSWCRADLRFPDTLISLNKNSFFSWDSLKEAYPGKTPLYVFEEHFDPRVVALLERRNYRLESMELTQFERTDRSNGAIIGGLSLLPSVLLALVVEKGISATRNEPYRWGRMGLLTAGFMVTVGVSYAITMDPKPKLYVTRIHFSPGPPPPEAKPGTPPLREVLE